MKKVLMASLIAAATTVNASDITLAKNIKKDLRNKIERDLNIIENFKFKGEGSALTLKVMGLSTLNGQSAAGWLNQRVNYVISENALSTFSLLIKRVIYVDKQDVDFPNANITPYSMGANFETTGLESQKTFTVMANIGTALYINGKKQKTVYGMKISRGFLHRSERVSVESPRAGIIQIGEGLFAPELTINNQNPDALANSIFRLATFFHEARHSDGNGLSLGYTHATCPSGHNYEGQAACDENLNGPYTVGALMMAEMSKACEDNCSEKEKQTLKIMVLDNASRILPITHKGEIAKEWDPTPESINR